MHKLTYLFIFLLFWYLFIHREPINNQPTNQLIKVFHDEVEYVWIDKDNKKQTDIITGMTACTMSARILQYTEPMAIAYCVYSPFEIY